MGTFIGIVEAANCVKIAQCDCVGAFTGIVDAANCDKIAQCDCVGAFIGIVTLRTVSRLLNVTVWAPS